MLLPPVSGVRNFNLQAEKKRAELRLRRRLTESSRGETRRRAIQDVGLSPETRSSVLTEIVLTTLHTFVFTQQVEKLVSVDSEEVSNAQSNKFPPELSGYFCFSYPKSQSACQMFLVNYRCYKLLFISLNISEFSRISDPDLSPMGRKGSSDPRDE